MGDAQYCVWQYDELVLTDISRPTFDLLVDTAMRVVNHANLSTDRLADVVKELGTHENLKDVIAWALSRPRGTFLPSVVGEVIVQDEFTHDVIVPWRDGLVLVYDTT